MNYSEAVLNMSEWRPCPPPPLMTPSDSLMIFIVNLVIVLISSLGLIGNLISGIVLSMPQMRSSYGLLLTSLTVSDSIQLVVYIIFFGSQALKYCGITLTPAYSVGPNFSKVLSMGVYVAYTASAYLTVLLSCERYTAVCKPFRALRIFPTKRRSFYYVVGVVTFAILFNLPKWLETQACQERVMRNSSVEIGGAGGDGVGGSLWGNSSIDEGPLYSLGEIKVIYNELFFKNRAYRIGYLFLANFFINFLIPLVTLMVLNVWIYNGMRETNRARQLLTVGQINDNSITLMLIVVVGIFCACHMWFAVKFILQEICEKCFDKVHVGITNCLLAFNASINFMIYCLCGSKFRHQLLQLFPSFKSSRFCTKGSCDGSRFVQTEVERIQV